MPRSNAIATAALMLVLGCSSACAGDFVPRTAGGFGAVGDDPASRATCSETPNAVMSEPESSPAPSVHSSPGSTAAHAAPIGTAKHVGIDGAVTDTRANGADGDDKPAASVGGAHKRSNLRWQSLLPGVMK